MPINNDGDLLFAVCFCIVFLSLLLVWSFTDIYEGSRNKSLDQEPAINDTISNINTTIKAALNKKVK